MGINGPDTVRACMCCLGGKKTKGFLIEAISASMGQKKRRDNDRGGASGTVVEEGECRGRCRRDIEKREIQRDKKDIENG